MSTFAEIEAAAGRLQRTDKLHLMESLWGDLSRTEAELESPAWHATALEKTERRVVAGREELIDWDRAKAELRERTV